MKRFSMGWCCAVLGAFAAPAQADWESSVIPGGYQTESSLSRALATASKEGKHVIVYYTRTNCPPCTVLQGFLRDETIGLPFRQGFVFTVVWGSSMGRTEREHYRERFDVQGAPTWLVYRRTGEYVCTAHGGFDGPAGAARLADALSTLLAEPPSSTGSAATRCAPTGSPRAT